MITKEQFKQDILSFINQSNGLRYSEINEMTQHLTGLEFSVSNLLKLHSINEILDEIIKDESLEVVEYSIPRENGTSYYEKLLLPKGTRIISIENAIESYKNHSDNLDSYPDID